MAVVATVRAHVALMIKAPVAERRAHVGGARADAGAERAIGGTHREWVRHKLANMAKYL